MEIKNHIFLIGMPGVGKSRLGIQIAQRLGLPFVDTDYCIMDKVGMSIHEIIEEYGINYFRKKEHSMLKELIQQDRPHVISTGGGMPIYNNNLDIMKKAGKVFWLDRKISDMFQSHKKYPRAGIQVHSQAEMLDLYYDRKNFYAQADKRVDISQKSLEEINSEIIAHV